MKFKITENLFDIEDNLERNLGVDKICGEVNMVCSELHYIAAKTTESTKLLRMHMSKFFDIIKANIVDGPIILNNLIKHLRGTNVAASNKIEEKLDCGRLELPFPVYFAAERGFVPLIYKLLREMVIQIKQILMVEKFCILQPPRQMLLW
ncbi:potassium channel AKT1-like isoform X3 [Impatiens glandulifera]|uniref:potassium channel AKT1-like isoform X3 n=1 Tax=Impatiens glandulifera TaxID=253017 RepID=UPI001FB17091|nr:potassium channel AKT1-like isoform X3 [Impatiens glandulifera]